MTGLISAYYSAQTEGKMNGVVLGVRSCFYANQFVSVAQGRPLTKRQASSAFFERRREGSVGFFRQ